MGGKKERYALVTLVYDFLALLCMTLGRPGPAEASGLMKRGDVLLNVDGKRVDGLPFDDVVSCLKASYVKKS